MTSPGALAAMFAALTRAQRLEWMERYLAVRPEYPAESWVQAAGDNYSMHGQGLICNILTGVAPLVAASERERLAAVISPEFFRTLADWFDEDDKFKTEMFRETWPARGSEVQDDLRRFTGLLEGGSGA